MTFAAQCYRVTGVDEVVAAGRAERLVAAEAAPAPDVLPRFGEVRTHSPGGRCEAAPVVAYVFANAVVHGAEGVITVGRQVVHESLMHVWPERAGAWQHGALWVTLREYVGSRLPAAEHLLCGNSGNYYHWLMDAMARSAALAPGATPVLAPSSGPPFQQGAAFLVEPARLRMLGPGEAVGVDRLRWTTSMTAAGGAYHPLMRQMGHRGQAAAAPGRDIYVSRADAAARSLRNEAAVEALAAARGFTPVRLTGMPLADQAALFAGARRIVAPHGAGLANLVFCRPGAAVLELTMDRYMNLCFRRLADCAGVAWGCVVGRAEPGGDPGWVHGAAWSLDLDRLAAALDDPAFMADPASHN